MARDRAYYQNQAARIARGAGIDPRVFTRQIGQESGFNPGAVSPAGAIGIAQIVPKYHPGVNPRDPIAALQYAAKMDANLLRRYGNWRDVLSVYNSGRPYKVGRSISETRNYVASILGGVNGANNHIRPGMPGGGSGTNDVFGGVGTRPKAMASFMLQNALNMAAGQSFDFGGMMAAFQQDRTEAANTITGTDAGGQDPNDPRVKMDVSGYAGPGGAKEMLNAIKLARRMGLRVSENDAVGQVHSVHVPGSYHYQDYRGTHVSRATDVSGSPAAMAAYYKAARRRYGGSLTELFYDPLGAIKNGRPISPVGGHRDHVHIAF